MRIFSGIIGLLTFIVGLAVMSVGLIGSSAINSDVDQPGWTCYSSGSAGSPQEDCTWKNDNPAEVEVHSQTATAFTIAGAALLISGAAFIGGAVAAPRKFVQLAAPQQPMMPVGPPR